MAIDLLSKFSVTRQVDTHDGLELIEPLLITDERIDLAYRHTRDRVWFTSKRIITLVCRDWLILRRNGRAF